MGTTRVRGLSRGRPDGVVHRKPITPAQSRRRSLVSWTTSGSRAKQGLQSAEARSPSSGIRPNGASGGEARVFGRAELEQVGRGLRGQVT
jgi:hypothetical protein